MVKRLLKLESEPDTDGKEAQLEWKATRNKLRPKAHTNKVSISVIHRLLLHKYI